MRSFFRLAAMVFLAALAGRGYAEELYNLDFTDPEVGAYKVNFGTPSVQHSVGPFSDALFSTR